MIETLMMTFSLMVLGYAFYISTRMFWSYRDEKGGWKWLYGIISAFIIATYFLSAIVLFSFLSSLVVSSSVMNLINVVLGIFLLAGAGLIGAVMKYHLSVMSRHEKSKIEKSGSRSKPTEGSKKLRKEILRLEDELAKAELLNRVAVGRELRIIELKKKIKEMEKGKKS